MGLGRRSLFLFHFIINFGDPDTSLRCIDTIVIVYTLAGWICIDGVEVDGAFLCFVNGDMYQETISPSWYVQAHFGYVLIGLTFSHLDMVWTLAPGRGSSAILRNEQHYQSVVSRSSRESFGRIISSFRPIMKRCAFFLTIRLLLNKHSESSGGSEVAPNSDSIDDKVCIDRGLGILW